MDGDATLRSVAEAGLPILERLTQDRQRPVSSPG